MRDAVYKRRMSIPWPVWQKPCGWKTSGGSVSATRSIRNDRFPSSVHRRQTGRSMFF